MIGPFLLGTAIGYFIIVKYDELQLKRQQNNILSEISYKLKRINYNC